MPVRTQGLVDEILMAYRCAQAPRVRLGDGGVVSAQNETGGLTDTSESQKPEFGCFCTDQVRHPQGHDSRARLEIDLTQRKALEILHVGLLTRNTVVLGA